MWEALSPYRAVARAPMAEHQQIRSSHECCWLAALECIDGFLHIAPQEV